MKPTTSPASNSRLFSGTVGGVVSSVVFLVAFRIAIGVRLVTMPYLQLLAGALGVGESLALPFGVVAQFAIGVGWALLFLQLFDDPRLLSGLVFSVWQTLLTLALVELVLLPHVGSSLTTLPIAQLVSLVGTFWGLHLVYVLTFLSMGLKTQGRTKVA